MILPQASIAYHQNNNIAIREKLHNDNLVDKVFDDNIKKCVEAMKLGVHPVRTPCGTSGSYFVRDASKKYIAIFKPKDEEPFASLNPKWPKYFQRILSFCCFGRACLIPNMGYMSEVGASLVDKRFQLKIVPNTYLVQLASPSFFYRKQGEFKLKNGSYQLFVDGFESANIVLAKWSHKSPLTEKESQKFHILFQKMCVLDYVIRNTDRHMDNWLIKYKQNEEIDIAAIDNGLAFPVKHPETASRLRPFPFEWANLSWALIPWDDTLKEFLLGLLTTKFVRDLCADLRTLFKYDPTANSLLIHNQLKVMRGQIWNLRCSLLNEESPAQMVKKAPILVSFRNRGYIGSITADWNEAFIVKPADYRRRQWC